MRRYVARMDRSDIVEYCLSKPGAWLDSPWGEGDHVAKVGRQDLLLLRRRTARDHRQEHACGCRASGATGSPDHIGTAAYLNKELWNQVVLEGPGAPDADDMRELDRRLLRPRRRGPAEVETPG